MIISIDGPAGSGKSTVADLLANKLGFIHFNSGSLYRAITVYAIQNNLTPETIEPELPKIKLSVVFVDNFQHVIINHVDLTEHLREINVSESTPYFSKIKSVRKIVDDAQRKFALTHNVVIEGRDIGSFVFPNADYKFYLDCSVGVRAKRRYKEEKSKGVNISFEEIKQQIIDRDNFDKNKPIAPLVIPEGAIIIDSTHKTAKKVADKMCKIILKDFKKQEKLCKNQQKQ